jgi:hypothetical protein
MRKLAFLPILALAFACADTVTDPAPLADNAVVAPEGLGISEAANPVVQRITGSGHMVVQPPVANPGSWRTFSMTARRMADGTVKGSYQRVVHPPDGGPAIVNHGTVTCFTVIGNRAWIGGHEEGYEPTDVAWQVEDNGEGKDADPDMVGAQIYAEEWGYEAGFAQDFCEATPETLDFGPPFGELPVSVVLYPIEAGNFQIK